MALSKKRYVEEAKTRVQEKLVGIDEQRDIIVNFLDEITNKAHAVGEQLLSVRDRNKFTKQYCSHMPQLETAWNQLFVIRTSLPLEDEETDLSESNSDSEATKNTDASSTPKTPVTQDTATPSSTRQKDAGNAQLHIKEEKEPRKTQKDAAFKVPEQRRSSIQAEIKTEETPDRTEQKQKPTESPSVQRSSNETSSIIEQTIEALHSVKEKMVNKNSEQELAPEPEPSESLPKVQKLNWPAKETKVQPNPNQSRVRRPTKELYKTPESVGRQKSQPRSLATSKSSSRAQSPAVKETKNDNSKEKPNQKPPDERPIDKGAGDSKPKPSKAEAKQNPNKPMKEPQKDSEPKPQENRQEKRETFVTVKPLDLSKSGEALDVYVLLILSPKLMWISPRSPSLDDQQDALNVYYRRLSPEQHGYLRVTSPVAGMYCCCPYSADDNWYRVRILEVIEKAPSREKGGGSGKKEYDVTVLYIDYGNQEVLEVSRLRQLVPKFAELRAHAIPCALSGVAPADGSSEWTARSLEVLGSMLLSRENVYATLSSLPHCPVTFVELFIPDQNDDCPADAKVRDMIDMSKRLIQESLARKADNHDIVTDLHRSHFIQPAFNPAIKSILSVYETFTAQAPILDCFEQNPPDIQRQTKPLKNTARKDSAEQEQSQPSPQDHPKQNSPLNKDSPLKKDAKKMANASKSLNLSKQDVKEVIKEAQKQIELSETSSIKVLQDLKVESDSGISAKSFNYNTSWSPGADTSAQSTNSLRHQSAPSPADLKNVKPDGLGPQRAQHPIDHSTPKQVNPPEEFTMDTRTADSSFKGKSSVLNSDLKGDPESTLADKASPVLKITPKEDPPSLNIERREAPEDSPQEGMISSVSTASAGSSESDDFKNIVCDEEVERELDRSLTEMKKTPPAKQQPELSDFPSVSSSSVRDLGSTTDSFNPDTTSNLDVSRASSSHGSSAKKLRNLGLPKNLPKSCTYSETYSKLMASSDEEDDEELPIGEYEPVSIAPENDGCLKFMFSHIDTPGKFWIHPVSENTVVIVEGIMAGLQDYMKENKKQRLKIFEGACAAKFSEDDQFYRGNIVSTKTKQEKTLIKVFYVDFGNTEWVPSDRVFYLAPQFLDLPPQAVRCSLADVKPLPWEKTSDQEQEEAEWSAKAIEGFKAICPLDKVFIAYVMTETVEPCSEPVRLGPTDSLAVLVIDTSEEKNRWVSLELADQGLVLQQDVEELFPSEAKQLKEENEQVIKERLAQWDPMAADYLSIRNSYHVDVDDPGVAAIGYKATDESRICRFYNMRKGCNAGNDCPYQHIKYKDQASITSDQREVFAADNQVEAPREGSWVAIEITTFFSPAHFYAIFPFGTKPIIEAVTANKDVDVTLVGDEGYVDNMTNSEALEALMEDLSEHYGRMSLPDSDLILRAPGEIVVAKFQADEQWYRARTVESDPDNGTVKVFYVDYGNTETVSEKDIRSMEYKFMHLPFQALECFLPLEPADGSTWTPEAKDMFRNMTDGKYLFAHILSRSCNGLLTLGLYDTEDDEVNLNAWLVEEGHAKPAVDMPCSFVKMSSTGAMSLTSNSSSCNSLHIVPG